MCVFAAENCNRKWGWVVLTGRKKEKNKRGFKFENLKRKQCEEKPAAGGRRSTRRRIDLKSGRRVAGLSEGDRHATQHPACVCNLFLRCDRHLLWPMASITVGPGESGLVVKRQCEQHKMHESNLTFSQTVGHLILVHTSQSLITSCRLGLLFLTDVTFGSSCILKFAFN